MSLETYQQCDTEITNTPKYFQSFSEIYNATWRSLAHNVLKHQGEQGSSTSWFTTFSPKGWLDIPADTRKFKYCLPDDVDILCASDKTKQESFLTVKGTGKKYLLHGGSPDACRSLALTLSNNELLEKESPLYPFIPKHRCDECFYTLNRKAPKTEEFSERLMRFQQPLIEAIKNSVTSDDKEKDHLIYQDVINLFVTLTPQGLLVELGTNIFKFKEIK